MKLSIIIPVYNREAYVEETLQSIVSQTGHSLDYEIIVVDDGSTDNSVARCEEMAKRYPAIRIVRQQNSGPGAARNNGLEHARGEYVWLVDSDDWMEQGALACLEPHLNQGFDAITFAAADKRNGEKCRRIFNQSLDGQVMSGRELMARQIHCGFLSLWFRFSVCLWHNVYRRAVLEQHHLQLAEYSLVDDFDFAPRVFHCLKRVLVLNDILYLIRQTPNSLSRSANPKKAFDYLTCARSLWTADKEMAVFASLAFCNAMTEMERTGSISADFLNAISEHRATYRSLLVATGNAKFLLMAVLLSVRVAWLVKAYNNFLKKLKIKK